MAAVCQWFVLPGLSAALLSLAAGLHLGDGWGYLAAPAMNAATT
jgi:hypothetical protein